MAGRQFGEKKCYQVTFESGEVSVGHGRSKGLTLTYSNCDCCHCLLNYTFVSNQSRFMVDVHKSKCPVKTLDGCVQGQGHSKPSQFQLMFV